MGAFVQITLELKARLSKYTISGIFLNEIYFVGLPYLKVWLHFLLPCWSFLIARVVSLLIQFSLSNSHQVTRDHITHHPNLYPITQGTSLSIQLPLSMTELLDSILFLTLYFVYLDMITTWFVCMMDCEFNALIVLFTG